MHKSQERVNFVKSEKISCSTNIAYLQDISAWLASHLPEALEEKRKGDILLVAQEIAANAMIHGNRSDPSKTVSVTLEVNDESITLVVEDEGKGEYELPTEEESRSMDILEEGGRGLKISRLLCREMFKDGGKITVVFDR